MTKFKKGDYVELIKDPKGGYAGAHTLGATATISHVSSFPAYYDLPSNYKLVGDEGNDSGWIEEDCLKQADANAFKLTPHIHRDKIIAWANGHEIEFYSTAKSNWLLIELPRWFDSTKYRIKPTKSTTQLKIEELEVRLIVLRSKL